ncbi:MAG: hypothetical protein QOG41_735 [Thermoleophilaceae bacterium]|nr:hypothetical protein [Thermoleophilaceae bacterium]MEA2350173.1 hypothetical protein [Thermoleophilaceae bacterium]MEA2387962.1 hypothetical protein [Thermoleophilaceae bacterium]
MEDLQRIGGGNRVRSVLFACALALLVPAGCGSEPSRAVPVECKDASTAVERALAAAPGEVRLSGTRLSDCFAPGSDSADGQALGLTFLPAAEHAAAEARAHPNGPPALRLGFLIGAVHSGVARGRVYAELGRRIDVELTGVDTTSAAYRRGERAGRDHG